MSRLMWVANEVNASDFHIQNDTCSGSSLGLNASCNFEIVFAPDVYGSKLATLEIPSDDPDTPLFKLFLDGEYGLVEFNYEAFLTWNDYEQKTYEFLTSVKDDGWLICTSKEKKETYNLNIPFEQEVTLNRIVEGRCDGASATYRKEGEEEWTSFSDGDKIKYEGKLEFQLYAHNVPNPLPNCASKCTVKVTATLFDETPTTAMQQTSGLQQASLYLSGETIELMSIPIPQSQFEEGLIRDLVHQFAIDNEKINIWIEEIDGNLVIYAAYDPDLEDIHVRQEYTDIPNNGSYDFGAVETGQSATSAFTIENRGVNPLTLELPVEISGEHADDFTVVQQPASPVDANTPVTLIVAFNPEDEGVRTAKVTIQNSDPGESFYTITLTGQGTSTVPNNASCLQNEYYPVIFIHGTATDAGGEDDWLNLIQGKIDSKDGYTYYGNIFCDDPLQQGLSPRTIFTFSFYKDHWNQSFYNQNQWDWSFGNPPNISSDANKPGYIGLIPKNYTGDSPNYYNINGVARVSYAERLARMVDKVLAATGASKVMIVAHSMGGLVSRAYIRWGGGADKVHKLLTVGTPNKGVPADMRQILRHIFTNIEMPLPGIFTLSLSDDWQIEGEYEEMTKKANFEGRSYTDWLNDGWEDFCRQYGVRYATIRGDYCPWDGNLIAPYIRLVKIGDGVVDVNDAMIDGAEFNGLVYAAHSTEFPPFLAKVPPPELSLLHSTYTAEVIRRWILRDEIHIGGNFIKYGPECFFYYMFNNEILFDYELNGNAVYASLFIHEINGDRIGTYGIPLFSGINQPVFDLEHLANGAYLYYLKAYDMEGKILEENGQFGKSCCSGSNEMPPRPIVSFAEKPDLIISTHTASFTVTSNLEGTQFSYKLDNNEWSAFTENSGVTLTNLKAGMHVIYLSGLHPNNGYTQQPDVYRWIVTGQDQKASIKVTPSFEKLSKEGGGAIFDVENTGSGTMRWFASVPEKYSSWLKLETVFDGADCGALADCGDIEITCEANLKGERTGIVVFSSCDANNSPQIIEVKQSGKYAVVTDPVNPTAQDDVAIAVSWDAPNSCYQISASSYEVNGNEININISEVHNGELCLDVITPLIVTETIGNLVSGDYILNVYVNQELISQSDLSVVAYHIITASAGKYGGIDPAGVVQFEKSGASQTFTITSDAEYQIEDVVVDGQSVGAVAGYTFDHIVSDHTIEARFRSIYDYGDIDHSGAVDLGDAILALQVLTGVDTGVQIFTDVEINGDGRIGLEEVIFILQKLSESSSANNGLGDDDDDHADIHNIEGVASD